MTTKHSTRRTFIKQAAAGIVAAGFSPRAMASSADPIPQRPFGKTGESVSLLGVGGFHIGAIREEKTAVRLVHEAIDMGVTFMDNAWEYHEGRSEEVLGKALQDGRRDKVFLMTKHHGRDKKNRYEALGRQSPPTQNRYDRLVAVS